MNERRSLAAIQSQISASISSLNCDGGYAHNIISLCLRSIAKKFGKDAANETIREFRLDKKGWSEQ